MSIQIAYISLKSQWTIHSSYDFLAHWQHSKTWCFSETAVQWFDVFSGLLSVLPALWAALTGSLSALPGLLSALSGLGATHIGSWLTLPALLLMLRGSLSARSAVFSATPAYMLVLQLSLLLLPGFCPVCLGAPTLVVHNPTPVANAFRSSPGCHLISYICAEFLLVLPGPPEGHWISPVDFWIWPPRDSGPTLTPIHSQTLQAIKIYFAVVEYQSSTSTANVRRLSYIEFHCLLLFIFTYDFHNLFFHIMVILVVTITTMNESHSCDKEAVIRISKTKKQDLVFNLISTMATAPHSCWQSDWCTFKKSDIVLSPSDMA